MSLHYTTIEDAKGWLGNKITLYGQKDSPNLVSIEEDLAIAEGMIDTFVSNQYPTPLTNTTQIAMVRGYIKMLFMEQAYLRSSSGSLPEGFDKSLSRVMKQLDKIGDGKVFLAGVAPDRAPDSPVVGSSVIVCAAPTRDAAAMAAF